MTVLSQCKLIWVQALKQNMHDLNQIRLKIIPVTLNKVPQCLQHILLMLRTFYQRDSVLLNQLKEHIGKADSNLKQSFCSCQLKIQLSISWSNQVEIV